MFWFGWNTGAWVIMSAMGPKDLSSCLSLGEKCAGSWSGSVLSKQFPKGPDVGPKQSGRQVGVATCSKIDWAEVSEEESWSRGLPPSASLVLSFLWGWMARV